jgi:hypothetical protein
MEDELSEMIHTMVSSNPLRHQILLPLVVNCRLLRTSSRLFLRAQRILCTMKVLQAMQLSPDGSVLSSSHKLNQLRFPGLRHMPIGM